MKPSSSSRADAYDGIQTPSARNAREQSSATGAAPERKEFPSLRHHHEWPFGPVDELRADFLLELPDRLAGSRLRYAVRGCAKREASGADHIAIETQRIEIHILSFALPVTADDTVLALLMQSTFIL